MEFDGRPPAWRAVVVIVGLALLVGAVSGGVAGGLIAALIPRDAEQPAAARSREPQQPTTVLTLKEESAVTEAVSKVLPGVVTLIVQADRRDSAGRVIRETNLGSGVVIDARGYIITNQHVVESSSSKIIVKLSNGEERPGAYVGDDFPFTDLAVIRVQPDGLSPVAVGDSESLALGQQVLAIGSVAFSSSAADFRNNVTRGIVSGLHRRWPRDDVVMEDLIQTDAAVNHGNSGGALVNLTGELVGIPTTVVRGTQGGFQVQGVAFAIPSSTFRPIVDEIIRSGKVQRPNIGIVHRQITAEIARQVNLPVENGVMVDDLIPESPASKAGIRRGDIITKLAGVEITEEMPYLNILVKQRPNATVPVTLLRAGREVTVEVTIALR